jgi:cell division protein FtsB
MKRVLPTVFLLLATILSFAAIFAGESYGRMQELKSLVKSQRESNQDLKKTVNSLKQEVTALENDPRSLEKAARNGLMLARPGEMVFLFDE